jgi:hypothetical protein
MDNKIVVTYKEEFMLNEHTPLFDDPDMVNRALVRITGTTIEELFNQLFDLKYWFLFKDDKIKSLKFSLFTYENVDVTDLQMPINKDYDLGILKYFVRNQRLLKNPEESLEMITSDKRYVIMKKKIEEEIKKLQEQEDRKLFDELVLKNPHFIDESIRK